MKKVFPLIILIFSLLLLIYTGYKSFLVFEGENKTYYFPYILISFTGIFVSILLFLVNENLREYLLISIISLIIGVYFFEVSLLLIDKNKNKNKINIYKELTGNNYDERNKLEIYKDLLKFDENVTVTVHHDFFLKNNDTFKGNIFPLSGISNKRTIYCNENGYYSIYQSDRYGFNNPDYEWDQSKIEYLLVGDSFTHGACVNRPNDIASKLRELSKKSVLNLGYGGNGPLIELASIKEYLTPNVKKVIWIYFKNDINDLEKELSNKILLKYLNDPSYIQNLKFQQNKIDELKKKLILEAKKNKRYITKIIKIIKLEKVRTIIYNFAPVKYKPDPKIQPEFKEIIKLAKRITELNNSEFYFVYLPSFNRYEYNQLTGYNSVKKIINDLNIPFIDLDDELFSKEKNPLIYFPFETSSHYNVEGYEKVSEIIYNKTQ